MAPSPNPGLARSRAAVELLEKLQAREGRISGDERKPDDDHRVLREIAQRKLMAERLDAGPPSSITSMQDALVSLVSEPDYEQRVEKMVAEMQEYLAEGDGDIWSRHERPDRRRHLSRLVARVEQASAECGLEIPRRPVIGTLPTYDINARAIPGPKGEGHLVVFDTGVFSYSMLLARAAAQAIDATQSEDGAALQFDPERAYQEPGYFVALARQWADLLFSQAVLGSCSLAELGSIAPRHAPFAEHLGEAINTFILAHEYGHVILKHTDLYSGDDSEQTELAHSQEFAADTVAVKICTAWGGSLWACLGATVFFYGSEAVNLATNAFLTGDARGKPSPTHPSPASRRRPIFQHFEAADPNAARISRDIYEALGKLTGYVVPGFVEAHRQGFPEAGYRAADELVKHVVFDGFWRGCVAAQAQRSK